MFDDEARDPHPGRATGLTRARHRDLRGRRREVWLRRAGLGLLLIVPIAGLAGAFGQQTSSSRARGAGATLQVDAPNALRGSLLWQGEVQVAPSARIAHPRIVLDRGWIDGMTINSITPNPDAEQEDRNGLTLAYGPIGAGDTMTVRVEAQVNPTTIGVRPLDVVLRDGATPLAGVRRRVRIYP